MYCKRSQNFNNLFIYGVFAEPILIDKENLYLNMFAKLTFRWHLISMPE